MRPGIDRQISWNRQVEGGGSEGTRTTVDVVTPGTVFWGWLLLLDPAAGKHCDIIHCICMGAGPQHVMAIPHTGETSPVP